MAVYDQGDRVKIYTSTPFQDEDGNAVDPNAVYFKVEDPDETETTYQYGVDSEVIKVTTGDYYMLVNADDAGKYKYSIWGEDGSSNNMGADEGFFMVRETIF